MPYRSSRLSRNYRKNNKKLIIISVLGIIAVSFGFIQLFPFILSGIGKIAIEETRGDDQKNISNILLAPQLDPIPKATDSAFITLSGSVTSDGTVEIVVNDSVVDRIQSESGSFETGLVKLSEGLNTITARLRSEGDRSDYSDPLEISVIKGEPSLEIIFPNDGDSFQKADRRITVKGKSNPDNTVTVNGFRAIVSVDGEFSYVYNLKNGSNEIVIEAKNSVGKTISDSVTVSYSE